MTLTNPELTFTFLGGDVEPSTLEVDSLMENGSIEAEKILSPYAANIFSVSSFGAEDRDGENPADETGRRFDTESIEEPPFRNREIRKAPFQK